MGRRRFARQQIGGSSLEKMKKVCRSYKYNSQWICVCSEASRREMSKETGERGVVFMFVADVIGCLAI
jgi:hypothetical protein